MKRLILVCGLTGAGKTTYSISLAKEIGAVRFSIDPWMQILFSKDMGELNYDWMIDRAVFIDRAQQLGIAAEMHFLDVPRDTRKARVEQRNREKDPAVYAFEVDDMMFNFMEPRFEAPDADELASGKTLTP